MNLLVTGGAGFIGSNFVHRVLEKRRPCHMVVLDKLTYAGNAHNIKHLDVDFEEVDICNAKLVSEVLKKHDITHVIHLAAESHVDRSIEGPLAFINTNIIGTFNLLEACRNHGTHRFHHVSTDEVYGSLELDHGSPFTECTPYAPNSPYAASKASSDLLVRAYHKTYGMDTVITHCSNNYGPMQHPEKLIPKVINNALERKTIPIYGDGLNVRDWIYVTDHCDALWEVLTRGKSGETYNIGSDNEISNLALVDTICRIMDETTLVRHGSALELVEFVRDRPGHDRRYAVNSSKIQNSLGWMPVENMASGLKKTVEWYTNKAPVPIM